MLAWPAAALETTANIAIKIVAEVQVQSSEQGRPLLKLVPADKVVPGDTVLYTLEVRNVGPRAIEAPEVVQPVPPHMLYVDNSAVGPGADVTFSVDGGRSFDRPENLTMPAASGGVRSAVGSDYTHIRWRLKSLVQANSVAFVRFRARVK